MANSLKLKQIYYIRAPIAAVFSAITKPKGLSRWMLQRAKLQAKKGGAYEFTWIGGYTEKGTVADLIENKRLVLNWSGNTKAAFNLKRKGSYTILEMVHTGFKNSQIEMWAGTKSGWAYYLMNLKSVLENRKDLRHPEDNVF